MVEGPVGEEGAQGVLSPFHTLFHTHTSGKGVCNVRMTAKLPNAGRIGSRKTKAQGLLGNGDASCPGFHLPSWGVALPLSPSPAPRWTGM